MDSVLVLNADYSPLNVTTLRKGFILVNKGKAEIIQKGEEDIITTIGNFVRPVIIRLLNYIRFRPSQLKVNRKRIFRRDRFTCQYCGSKRNLTLDHVMPRSRGGNNSWTNMVTCCSRCNSKKGNRTPEEANMCLMNKPYEPYVFSSVLFDEVEEVWSNFKVSFFS